MANEHRIIEEIEKITGSTDIKSIKCKIVDKKQDTLFILKESDIHQLFFDIDDNELNNSLATLNFLIKREINRES